MKASSGRIHNSHDVFIVDVSENVPQNVLSLSSEVVAVGDSIQFCVFLCVSDGLRNNVNTNNIANFVRETETCNKES